MIAGALLFFVRGKKSPDNGTAFLRVSIQMPDVCLIFRASQNRTYVLYFDHLNQPTPGDAKSTISQIANSAEIPAKMPIIHLCQ